MSMHVHVCVCVCVCVQVVHVHVHVHVHVVHVQRTRGAYTACTRVVRVDAIDNPNPHPHPRQVDAIDKFDSCHEAVFEVLEAARCTNSRLGQVS